MSDKDLIKYQPTGSIEDWISFGSNSHRLTARKATKLEEELESLPDDLTIRLQLLEYFFVNRYSGSQRQLAKKPLLKHLLWFIDNHPEHIVLANPFGLNKDEDFRIARLHWLKQVRNNSTNVGVLYHAAMFCFIHRADDAARFLRKASIVDTRDDRYPHELATIYSNMSHSVSTNVERRKFALAATKQMKIAVQRYAANLINQSQLNYDFEVAVEEIAELAISRKLFKEAGELANILLNREAIEESRGYFPHVTEKSKVARILSSKNRGRAILSKMALAEKDIPLAKEHLESLIANYAYGKFEFKLANGLLRKNEREIVLRYLKRVKDVSPTPRDTSGGFRQTSDKYWDEQLSFWISEIEQGRTPRITER